MDPVNQQPPAPSPASPAPRPGAPEHDWRARLRNSRLGTVAVLAVTTLLVVGGAYVVATRGGDGGVSDVDITARATGPAPEIGQPAQDFTATTLEGETVSLSDFRGRPVWLLFGATWCSSCRAEAPDVQDAHERYGDDLVILSLYLGEGRADVAAYAQRTGLTYRQLPDPTSQISASYRVMGVPAHFFLDAEGVLRETAIGALSPADIDKHISAIS